MKLAALLGLGASIFGASTTGGADPVITALLNGGPFAILLLLFVSGRIATSADVKRAEEREHAARAELREANNLMLKEVMPVLGQVANGFGEVLAAVRRSHGTAP